MPFDPNVFIAEQRWTFAKTMPTNPHEYIVRFNIVPASDFDAFARFIRENGEERVWGGKKFIYWTAPDGHRYWTMGWPLWPEEGGSRRNHTFVLNRVKPEDDKSVPVTDETRHLPYSSPDGRYPVC